MRKSRLEAANTREKIIGAAAREFNENGIAGSGIAAIMEAAGLTHGGFYRHFESKEQLVAETVSKSLDRVSHSMESTLADKSLDGKISAYLSRNGRNTAFEACPLSALGSELQHADAVTREIASEGVLRFVSVIESHLADLPKNEARRKARAIVAAMVGGMMLSRIVTDTKISDSFLRDTKSFILQA